MPEKDRLKIEDDILKANKKKKWNYIFLIIILLYCIFKLFYKNKSDLYIYINLSFFYI